MPPRAILSSVCRTMCSAWVSPVRAWCRNRTLRSIGWGNLGAWPNPPWSGSKLRMMVRAAWSSSLASSAPEPLGSVPNARNCSVISAADSDDLVASFLPGLVHAREDAGKTGHAPRVGRRKIRAAEERLELGREEHRHRPAAVPGHRHHGRHVDLVEVGALFTVDLDVDEVLVHEGRDVRVLEALALHDVAPVAGRVADRQEDRLVLGLWPWPAPLAPTDTSRPGWSRAGASTGWSRRPGGWSCERCADADSDEDEVMSAIFRDVEWSMRSRYCWRLHDRRLGRVDDSAAAGHGADQFGDAPVTETLVGMTAFALTLALVSVAKNLDQPRCMTPNWHRARLSDKNDRARLIIDPPTRLDWRRGLVRSRRTRSSCRRRRSVGSL